jgi:hypothetical protein
VRRHAALDVIICAAATAAAEVVRAAQRVLLRGRCHISRRRLLSWAQAHLQAATAAPLTTRRCQVKVVKRVVKLTARWRHRAVAWAVLLLCGAVVELRLDAASAAAAARAAPAAGHQLRCVRVLQLLQLQLPAGPAANVVPRGRPGHGHRVVVRVRAQLRLLAEAAWAEIGVPLAALRAAWPGAASPIGPALPAAQDADAAPCCPS